MFVKKFLFSILILFACLLSFTDCRKHDEKKVSETPMEYIENESTGDRVPVFITKKKNIKRSGSMRLEVDDVTEASVQMQKIITETKGQILDEHITSDNEGILTAWLKIRIPSENFSLFLNKISKLGKLINVDIHAQDLTDTISQKDRDIHYLSKRLAQAEKEQNEKLVLKLRRQIQKLKGKRASVKWSTVYSYIELSITQKIGFIDSIVSGLGIASAVLKVIIKVFIVLIAIAFPLIIVLIAIRFIRKYLNEKFGNREAVSKNKEEMM